MVTAILMIATLSCYGKAEKINASWTLQLIRQQINIVSQRKKPDTYVPGTNKLE
jgi:hypothetical protein